MVLRISVHLQRTSKVHSWLLACSKCLFCVLVGYTQGARPLARH